MTAQLEPAAEIHWSRPCGKPLSRYGWIGMERVRTSQEPSSSCVRSRYCMAGKYSSHRVIR